jgi:hypothetical protein
VNHAVELHDSRLAAVSLVDTSAVLEFSAAYVHESAGEPSAGAGTGWYQPATFTVTAAAIASPVQVPASVAGGSLRLGSTLHRNLVPAAGTFEGPIELSLQLSTAETLTIRGDSITIKLAGERSPVEQFSP